MTRLKIGRVHIFLTKREFPSNSVKHHSSCQLLHLRKIFKIYYQLNFLLPRSVLTNITNLMNYRNYCTFINVLKRVV